MPTVTVELACSGKSFDVQFVEGFEASVERQAWKPTRAILSAYRVTVFFSQNEIVRGVEDNRSSIGGSNYGAAFDYNYRWTSTDANNGQISDFTYKFGPGLSFPPFDKTANNFLKAAFADRFNVLAPPPCRFIDSRYSTSLSLPPLSSTSDDTAFFYEDPVNPLNRVIKTWQFTDNSYGTLIGVLLVNDGVGFDSETGYNYPKYKSFHFLSNLAQMVGSPPSYSPTVEPIRSDGARLEFFGVSDSTLNAAIGGGCVGIAISDKRSYHGIGDRDNQVFVVRTPPSSAYKMQGRRSPMVGRAQTFHSVAAKDHLQPCSSVLYTSGGAIAPQTIRLPCGVTVFDDPYSPKQHGNLPYFTEWCAEGSSSPVMFYMKDIVRKQIGTGQYSTNKLFTRALVSLNTDFQTYPIASTSYLDSVSGSDPAYSSGIIRAWYYDCFCNLLNAGGTPLTSLTESTTDWYAGGYSTTSIISGAHTPPQHAVRVRFTITADVTYGSTSGTRTVNGCYVPIVNSAQASDGDLRYATIYGDFLPGMHYERVMT